jgi:hypothetical protein
MVRCLAFCLYVMLSVFSRIAAVSAQPLDLPGTGVWNSFNRHFNVLECANVSESPYTVLLSVRNDAGTVVATRTIYFPAYGTTHVVLNSFVEENEYGTYLLETPSHEPQSQSPLNCATAIYRFPASAATRAVEYAFSIPVKNTMRGESAGTFNSYNPSGGSTLTENWLSIINPGSSPFAAWVELYNQDGSRDNDGTFLVWNLQPGQRRDFALGHERGQRVGLYRILPVSSDAPYIAFVTRFGKTALETYNFAFPLLAQAGSCDPGPVPASTMDPAHNWAELANPSAVAIWANVELRDANGELRYQDNILLEPRAQQHLHLNPYLGERSVGTLHVRCGDPGQAQARLLVQSAFYGYRSSVVPVMEWAYVSQAGGEEAAEGSRVSSLVNTYLGAANWSKYADSSAALSSVNLSVFDGAGKSVAHFVRLLYPSAGSDIAIHEDAGQDFAGQAMAYSNTHNSSFKSELLRVFPDSRGGIGYIMNSTPVILPPVAKETGAVRVSPSGHYLEFRGNKILIAGDSVTQAWMELGRDFDYTAYLNNLQAHGINALMIWSYVAIVDQVEDSRIGYDAPRLWPWQETSLRFIPPYSFEFVDSSGRAKFNDDYFNVLRSIVKAANDREILVLLTVHDGWTKYRFAGHPFNQVNGGPLGANYDYVNLADYSNEMPDMFNPSWSNTQKHQFYLERFCDRILRATADFPNVLYEMFNEGEWYDQTALRSFQNHFLDFFRARTDLPLLVNSFNETFRESSQVDVLTLHSPNWNSGSDAIDSFSYYASRFLSSNPIRKPLLFNEPVPSYEGDPGSRTPLRRLMWGSLLGGAGFFVQNDSNWFYRSGEGDPIFDVESAAARFFKYSGAAFSEMEPDGDLCSLGVCLAHPGEEYLAYTQSVSRITVDLSASSRDFLVRFYNPSTGQFDSATQTVGGGSGSTELNLPDGNDWLVWLKGQ